MTYRCCWQEIMSLTCLHINYSCIKSSVQPPNKIVKANKDYFPSIKVNQETVVACPICPCSKHALPADTDFYLWHLVRGQNCIQKNLQKIAQYFYRTQGLYKPTAKRVKVKPWWPFVPQLASPGPVPHLARKPPRGCIATLANEVSPIFLEQIGNFQESPCRYGSFGMHVICGKGPAADKETFINHVASADLP